MPPDSGGKNENGTGRIPDPSDFSEGVWSRETRAKQSYAVDSSAAKARSKANYARNPIPKQQASVKNYASDPSKQRAASKKSYASDPRKIKLASKKRYALNKAGLKAYNKQYYQAHKQRIQAARRQYYCTHRSEEIAAARARNIKNAKAVLRRARRYYVRHGPQCRSDTRWRYELAEPKCYAKEQHVLELTKKLMLDSKVLPKLVKAFDKKYKSVSREMTTSTRNRAVSSIAAKVVVTKVLQVRKHSAGTLLKAVRSISKIELRDRSDFGDGLHCAHSEPYFYESAYQFEERPQTLIVDEQGRCRPTCNEANEDTTDSVPKCWKCCSKCKPVTDSELSTILKFKSGFAKAVREVRKLLDKCDDCPNHRYTKVALTSDDNPDSNIVHYDSVQLGGHGLPCVTGRECSSELRILRAASTHFPTLRSFLRAVYDAFRSHKATTSRDEALRNGDFVHLMSAAGIDGYNILFDTQIESTGDDNADDSSVIASEPKLVKLELALRIKHAKIIALYDKAVLDFAQHPCCSCNRLFQKKAGTVVRFSDKIGTMWRMLKQHILKEDPQAAHKKLFMCTYCKTALRRNDMSPRCVLNGLETVPIPAELAKLDCLSRQFVQKAKAYQTVVRLGTYTHKVPTYNSLKACKGTMFFLPLPLEKTMATLDEVEESDLPNPELYIIVNGKPTKNNVVWRNLLPINDIKAAVKKLSDINWLYKDTDDTCIDTAAKEVIKVVNEASCTMLEKASDAEVSQFQCYTIRNLDNKLSTESDIEQYKLLNVTEKPLDNRQLHLDVMCFPVLFPDGKFGKYHPRQRKLSHAEYDKSRLLNKDPRFRKDPQYIFFLMWQKEMRELAAGVYNLMQSSRTAPMSVKNLLHQVQTSSDQLEANLSTMLQTVRGTKQYWFRKKGELLCIVREAGPPTLFLTFSCAEYEAPDIINYLKTVNDVPDNYNKGKLCTEDPVSVSRQFSQKFHAADPSKGSSIGVHRPLLLEEGISGSWGSPLSCALVDTRCTCHWHG